VTAARAITIVRPPAASAAPGEEQRRMAQRGMSLVELLVAVTILALATLVALQVYDDARRSYEQGDNLVEQQQAVRVSVDRLTSALRMAGFNTNPDGNPERPDEQIEAALATAVVVRADYDYHDPVESVDPEEVLAGPSSAFLTVSTGNDEIRAFVLAKAGRSGPDTLDFQADVGQLYRDGIVEDVAIDNVALVQDDPPYTLYRITLDDAAAPVATPLIDNVRSMRFRYFDKAGNEVVPAGGADTPALVARRAAIRRIGVDIEVMTHDPDRDYVDPSDPDPDTRAFRKFRRTEDISPRNLGMVGIKDVLADSTAPSRPLGPPDLELHEGHCGGLYVTWPPNPPEDEVAYYRVRYGIDPADLGGVRSSRDTGFYLGGGLADDETYFVTVEAVDAAGNPSPPSDVASERTSNLNTPVRPELLHATSGERNHVPLDWERVALNTGPTYGDPESQMPEPLARDIGGYRIYRSLDADFAPDASNRIGDESEALALPEPTFSDEPVINCQEYFYRVTAVDQCGVESEPSDVVAGASFTDIQPRHPTNASAYFLDTGSIEVRWGASKEDVENDPIVIEDYKVFRTMPMPEDAPEPTAPDDFFYIGDAGPSRRYYDPIVFGVGQTVWYYVTAQDRCSPPNVSGPSRLTRPICSFSGDVEFAQPGYDAPVWNDADVTVQVSGGSGTYSAVRLEFVHDTTGTVVHQVALNQPGPSWTVSYRFHPSSGSPVNFPSGSYTVTAEVDQAFGPYVCNSSTTTRLRVSPN
jgi:prepilin-type N-terminal cleavage/methylation domain-containing protein